MSQIASLVAFAKANNTDETRVHEFGFIPNWQAQEINMETGVKVNEVTKVITDHGILHAIKQHGDDAIEKPRGQKGITDADFDLIPKIVADFDSVQKGNTKGGNKGLLFIKKINNINYHVVMTLKNNRGNPKLEFSTMYARLK